MDKFNFKFTEFQRRQLLKGLLAGGAALALAPLAQANTALALAKDATYQKFIAASLALTGKKHLDDDFAERIFRALSHDQQFKQAITDFAPSGETSSWSEQDKQTAMRLLKAWYLGIVTQDNEDKVVGFDQALMYAAVEGAVGVRSFCFAGAPGDWAKEPVLASAALANK